MKKAKGFSLDTTTLGGKAIDFKFFVINTKDKSDITDFIRETMKEIGKPYSIYVSPKTFEVEKTMSFEQIKQNIKDALGVKKED